MKASVLSPLVVVFVAAAGIYAASPVDAYKNLAMSGGFTPERGYSGDLILLAKQPVKKIKGEPRVFASKFLVSTRRTAGGQNNPRVDMAKFAGGTTPAPATLKVSAAMSARRLCPRFVCCHLLRGTKATRGNFESSAMVSG